MAESAHLAAVRMLARRELSEAQIRSRLARRGHDHTSIDTAIARLRADGSLDDARVARALARTESAGRTRGRLRVRQRLAAAGIAPAVAERAIAETFEQVDEAALLRAALEKRLGGRHALAGRQELARLYRHLVARGFAHDAVMALLRSLPLVEDE